MGELTDQECRLVLATRELRDARAERAKLTEEYDRASQVLDLVRHRLQLVGKRVDVAERRAQALADGRPFEEPPSA